MIGRSGERWSEISVLVARHDDDDDIYYNFSVSLLFASVGSLSFFLSLSLSQHIYIYIYKLTIHIYLSLL